jgi:hypothetical protein
MANALYDKGREGFLDGNIDWDTNNIKLVFVDEADDTIDLAVDDNLDDRAVASRVATSGNFAGKTVTNGVADADDVTVATVTGDPFESIDIYKDTGTESTSRLIANIDTATGLPLTPNGGDITVQWDSGSNRIFKL